MEMMEVHGENKRARPGRGECTENETALREHGEVASAQVPLHRSFVGHEVQLLPHLSPQKPQHRQTLELDV